MLKRTDCQDDDACGLLTMCAGPPRINIDGLCVASLICSGHASGRAFCDYYNVMFVKFWDCCQCALLHLEPKMV